MVNSNSIQQKVQEYAKSPDGKRRMRDCIEDYFERGVEKTDAGSLIISRRIMRWLADELISIIKESAETEHLPESVLAHFDYLSYTPPVRVGENGYSMRLYFSDDLSRPSFEVVMWEGNNWHPTGNYTGGGIDDIVSLFNTGYAISNTVYGLWQSKGIVASARVRRDGLHFMERSIASFNQTYGKEYRVTASLMAVID